MKLKLCAIFLCVAACSFGQVSQTPDLAAVLVAEGRAVKAYGGWLDLPLQASAGADVYVWITCNVDPAHAPCVLVVMSGLGNNQFTQIGQPVYNPLTNKQEQLFVGHMKHDGPTIVRAVTDPIGDYLDFGVLALEVDSRIEQK